MRTHVKTFGIAWQWGRAIAFIRRLEQHPLKRFSSIVSIPCEGKVELPYLGRQISHPETFTVPMATLRAQMDEILVALGECQIRHRDITYRNLLWLPDRGLTLIDFGWSTWFWEPAPPVSVPETMRTWYCETTDAEQAEAALDAVRNMRSGREPLEV